MRFPRPAMVDGTRLAAACLSIVLLAACQSAPVVTPTPTSMPPSPSSPTTGDAHTVTGDVLFVGQDASSTGGGRCVPEPGSTFAGIGSGTKIVLRDGAGQTLAASRLVETGDSGTRQSDLVLCHFTFRLDDVPRSDVYKVTVGTLRGPTFTYEQLANLGWTMSLR